MHWTIFAFEWLKEVWNDRGTNDRLLQYTAGETCLESDCVDRWLCQSEGVDDLGQSVDSTDQLDTVPQHATNTRNQDTSLTLGKVSYVHKVKQKLYAKLVQTAPLTNMFCWIYDFYDPKLPFSLGVVILVIYFTRDDETTASNAERILEFFASLCENE